MFFTKALAFALIFIYANALSDDFTVALNGFTNKFYKAVGDSKPGTNTVISGFSASTCLAFLSAGTRGATQSELVTALGFPSQADIESAFQPALTNMKNVQGITLNIANKAYIQDFPGLDLEPSFKQTATDVFFSEVEKIDFAVSDNARTTINQWIKDKTEQRITETLKSGDITALTRVVLVNAVYYKALWENPFDSENTRKYDFNVNLNKKVQVDMMGVTDSFGLLKKSDWGATVVELYYKEKQASMVIIVPDKIDGLAEVEKKVTASNIKQDVFDQIIESTINLNMPKFKIETDINLKTILPELGINLIFDQMNADLTGLLNKKEKLYVTTAIQKAFIEVHEKGTEAGATTVIVAGIRRLPPSVVCDRPFLFFVKLATGEILFSGRYTGSEISNGDGNGTNNGGALTPDQINKCLQPSNIKRPDYCEKYFPTKLNIPNWPAWLRPHPVGNKRSNLRRKP